MGTTALCFGRHRGMRARKKTRSDIASDETARRSGVGGELMFEHRDAFIETVRSGRDARKRVFDILEQRHSQDFPSGRMGKNLYDVLHSAVNDAAVPGVIEEFEKRFSPLLDPARLRKAEPDPTATAVAAQAAAGRRSGVRGWVAAAGAVAVVAGALAIGLHILNTVVAKAPTTARPAIAQVPAVEAAQEAAAGAAETATGTAETATGAVPAQVVPVDQEASSER